MRMKKSTKRLLFKTFLVLVFIASIVFAVCSNARYERQKSVTEDLAALAGVGEKTGEKSRVAFAIYIDGSEISFWDAPRERANKYAYLEVGEDGNVAVMKASGITVQQFFRAVGMDVSRTCISINGNEYCSQPEFGRTLKFYVNGMPNADAPNYALKDGDTFLVSYGRDSYSDVQKQLGTIGTPVMPPAEPVEDQIEVPVADETEETAD